MYRFYRVLRPASFPVGVLLGLEVGFEDGFEDDHGGRLCHSVGDRRYAQRAQFAVRLGYPDAFDRLRSIVFLLEPFRQFSQPALRSVRFDFFKVYPVYAGPALVGFAASVGKFKNVSSLDLVVQEVEPVAGLFLRFGV